MGGLLKGKLGQVKIFFFFLTGLCWVNGLVTSYVSREVIWIGYCKEKCAGILGF